MQVSRGVSPRGGVLALSRSPPILDSRPPSGYAVGNCGRYANGWCRRQGTGRGIPLSPPKEGWGSPWVWGGDRGRLSWPTDFSVTVMAVLLSYCV